MDALGIEQAVLGGHSYGGLLTYDMAAHHPERVAICVVMDAPAQVHPKILDQAKSSVDRLEMSFPSLQAYLDHAKAMPYYAGLWDDALEELYVTTFARIRTGPCCGRRTRWGRRR